MDQRAYIDPITGRPFININGRFYIVTIDSSLNIGEHKINGDYVNIRHTDDAVWHLVWKNFLTSERVKAHRSLRNKAIETRISLGLSTQNPSTFPLPFQDYNYNFT